MVEKQKNNTMIEFFTGTFVIIIIFLLYASCGNTYYKTQETEIRYIEKHKIHDIGIEVWCRNTDGVFMKHENIYPYNGNSRVVVIYDLYINGEKKMKNINNIYLYLNQHDYDEYILEKYSIEG